MIRDSETGIIGPCMSGCLLSVELETLLNNAFNLDTDLDHGMYIYDLMTRAVLDRLSALFHRKIL